MGNDGDRDSAELREIGKKWAQAEQDGDIAALDDLLAEEFIGVGPLGFLLTKEQWTGRYKSGDLHNKEFGWEPTSIRHYGSVAIMIGIQSQDTTYKGQPIQGGRFRLTQVLMREEGRWRLISAHISNLAPNAG